MYVVATIYIETVALTIQLKYIKSDACKTHLVLNVHFVNYLLNHSFAPFITNIEQDHPYLGNISLVNHVEEGNVYIVDLSDVAIDEDTVSYCNRCHINS